MWVIMQAQSVMSLAHQPLPLVALLVAAVLMVVLAVMADAQLSVVVSPPPPTPTPPHLFSAVVLYRERGRSRVPGAIPSASF